MVKKCCVARCNGNFDGRNKVSVFRFPKDPEENQRWRSAIPRENIPTSVDTVVCERHWPQNYEFILVRSKKRPIHPPSVFPNVPDSVIPTAPPKPRPTSIACSSTRNILPDQQEQFLNLDKIQSFESLCDKFIKDNHNFNGRFSLVSFKLEETCLIIQSKTFEEPSCIPTFLLKIMNDYTYIGYHCGISCTISPLSTNRIYKLNTWSILEEAISFLNLMEKNQKKQVLLEQVFAMSPLVCVGDKKYNTETIVRAFDYFATSRTLYNRLRDDYELPSVSTLTRLTSKVNKVDDTLFLKNIFTNIEENQTICEILIDEIYVKPSLTYHGGAVFGKAVNEPDKLATTVLGYYIVTLFGGPKFLLRMMPVHNLKSDFLFEETNKVMECIDNAGGTTLCVICDNNRVNQSFFKKFDTVIDKPWLTKDGKFLLFVHILKSIYFLS